MIKMKDFITMMAITLWLKKNGLFWWRCQWYGGGNSGGADGLVLGVAMFATVGVGGYSSVGSGTMV